MLLFINDCLLFILFSPPLIGDVYVTMFFAYLINSLSDGQHFNCALNICISFHSLGCSDSSTFDIFWVLRPE